MSDTHDTLINLDDLLAEALEGIEAAKRVGASEAFEEWHRARPTVPIPAMLIAADGFGVVPITVAGYAALAKWVRKLRDTDGNLQKILSREEWHQTATTNFMRTLSAVAHDADENAHSSSTAFEEKLRQRLKAEAIAAHVGPRVEFFPAHFATEPLVKGFSVGPVRFVPSTKIEAEIRRLFRSRGKFARLARDTAIEHARYWRGHVTCFLRVSTDRLGRSYSAQRAREAARLMMVGALLPWRHDVAGDARLLDEAASPRQHKRLAFRTDQATYPGWAIAQPALKNADVVGSRKREYVRYKLALGRMLESFLDPRGRWLCPRIGGQWLMALHWYHRGMSAELDFESIVYFGMALDTLCEGKRADGITRCASVILNRAPDTALFQGSSSVSVNAFVKELYERGRSRISHGTDDILRRDYSDLRARAHRFVHILLLEYAKRLVEYERAGGKDSVTVFLGGTATGTLEKA